MARTVAKRWSEVACTRRAARQLEFGQSTVTDSGCLRIESLFKAGDDLVPKDFLQWLGDLAIYDNAGLSILAEAGRAGSSLTKTAGSNLLGPFTRLDIRTPRGVLETTLQGKVLQVDYAEGASVLFQLRQIQAVAGGPGAFNEVRGYVTGELATRVNVAGYIDNVAQLTSSRLGGSWNASLVQEGAKTWLVLLRSGT